MTWTHAAQTTIARTAMIVLLGSMGCSEASVASAPGYYEQVKPILDGRCVGCHQEGNIGPFNLSSYEDAAAVSGAIRLAVERRTMPPWGAAPGHRSYAFDPTLSDAQIATIAAWVDAGAPEGEPSQEGPPLPSVTHQLSRVDVELKMPVPYVPTGSPDEYRCIILDWPETETVYVTGFNARPGNRSLAHHIGAFLVTPDNPFGQAAFDSLAELDDAESGLGYTCFGGPAGESGVQIPAQQVGQWVPGQGGGDFPAGTGIEVPPGSKIVLQMHYFSSPNNTQSDQTSLELSFETSIEHRAAFAPWLDVAWVFGGMNIPADNALVAHSVTDDPRTFFDAFVGNVDLTNGFVVHAGMLHMHKLGTHAEVAIERSNGDRDVLVEVPDYDFNWQRLYQLSDAINFEDGDKLSVACQWDNSAANQPTANQQPQDVNWGEGTGDEMCVANLYISEP